MNNWNKNEAQINFDKLMQACHQSPQILYDNDQAIAAVIDIKLFNQWFNQPHPTIAEMLTALTLIQQENPIEFEISQRIDRPNPLADSH